MKITAPLCQFTLAILFAYWLGTSSAHGQANLSFSGGMGTPLMLTLAQPITYKITTAESAQTPCFVFQSVGDLFSSRPTLTGNITYNINFGVQRPMTLLGSGVAEGATTAADAYFLSVQSAVSVGATVTLSAGTVTSTTDFAGAIPASGTFTTFIIWTGDGSRISTNGISIVPEPSTWVFLFGGSGLLCFTIKRQPRRAGRMLNSLR